MGYIDYLIIDEDGLKCPLCDVKLEVVENTAICPGCRGAFGDMKETPAVKSTEDYALDRTEPEEEPDESDGDVV